MSVINNNIFPGVNIIVYNRHLEELFDISQFSYSKLGILN